MVPRNFHGTESIECEGPLSKATAIEEQKQETQDNFIQFATICTYAAIIRPLPGVVPGTAPSYCRFYERHGKKDEEQNISIQDSYKTNRENQSGEWLLFYSYGQRDERQKWGPVTQLIRSASAYNMDEETYDSIRQYLPSRAKDQYILSTATWYSQLGV